jgi:thiol-disulfide isomerase/thioredoxin
MTRSCASGDRWAGVLSIALWAVSAGCRTQEGDNGAPDPSPSSASSANEHVRTLHPPAQGDVATIVRGEYEKATTNGRKLVVYLGATWCEPCQRFHRAVEHGDMDATFPRLTLLEFDADKDQERLRVAGYSSRYIPMFALPKADGTASGKQVEGGIKGDGAVNYVSDKLKGLLAQN